MSRYISPAIGIGLAIAATLGTACQQTPGAKPTRSSASARGAPSATGHTSKASTAGSQGVDGSPAHHGYPGASRFCSGHVTGAPQAGAPGPHISWVAYTTADAQTKVATYYRAKLGEDGYAREATEDTWRLTAEKPERTISLSPATKTGPWNRCGELPSDAATVILVSTMAAAK